MKTHRINYVKWIKLCVAVPAAMVMAKALGLSFAPSAGIITLLAVFNTKKETFQAAFKRVLAFGIMLALCKLIFGVAGCNIPAYAVFLCLFLFLCYLLRLEEAIAMNAVLATHFLSEGSVSLSMAGNEALLFVIGTGLGIAVNLIMPGNLSKIRDRQGQTDAAMKRILLRMADYLCREDKAGYTGDCFAQVEELLADLEKEAQVLVQNTLDENDRYFLKYMRMRAGQCAGLKDIYAGIVELSGVPEQAVEISDFIREIGESFHEMNNVERLLARQQELMQYYKTAPLPVSREEFEDRATLLHILRCLYLFLLEKREFVQGLTAGEKARYWTE